MITIINYVHHRCRRLARKSTSSSRNRFSKHLNTFFGSCISWQISTNRMLALYNYIFPRLLTESRGSLSVVRFTAFLVFTRLEILSCFADSAIHPCSGCKRITLLLSLSTTGPSLINLKSNNMAKVGINGYVGQVVYLFFYVLQVPKLKAFLSHC